MRFGVPRFGFKDKKKVAEAESSAPATRQPAPQAGLPDWAQPKAAPTEPEWGAPIIEVNDQAVEPEWGAPIIEVNPLACESAVPDTVASNQENAVVAEAESQPRTDWFGPAQEQVPDREWGLESLAAETALEPDVHPRHPMIAELAEGVAAQAALPEVPAVELKEPYVTGPAPAEDFNPFITEPVFEALPPEALNSAHDWPQVESVEIQPLATEPVIDNATNLQETRVWDREIDLYADAYPTAAPENSLGQEPPTAAPTLSERTAFDLTADPTENINSLRAAFFPAADDIPPVADDIQPMANDFPVTNAFPAFDEIPATAPELPELAVTESPQSVEQWQPERTEPAEVHPFQVPAEVTFETAITPLEMSAARPEASMEGVLEAPAVADTVPVEQPDVISVATPVEAPSVTEEISSLQGIALAEELQLVSEGLWSYKQYLEQYQSQLQREVQSALEGVGAQLAAFEDQAATLRREFTVGMDDGNKVGILEQGTPDLAAIVASLDQARQQQSKQLVLLENLTAITQRYSDLLEKVVLFEGNLRRYMKQVDGTAKQRLRETSRQEFFASSAIIRSQEMERQRIAREIHDGPAQAIANVILRLDLVEKMMAQKPELVGREFAKMKEIAQGALNEIRGFIFDLRPMTLQDLGLTATLKKIVQSNQGLSDSHVEFIVEGTEAPLSAEAELAIFRIAQEALTNVKKHALANNAYVHLKYLPGEVVLIVEDDGHGFEANKTVNGDYTHFGLIGMQERAEDIDGDLQVISQKGRGTKVIFSLRTG